jgi:hypothetical protein
MSVYTYLTNNGKQGAFYLCNMEESPRSFSIVVLWWDQPVEIPGESWISAYPSRASAAFIRAILHAYWDRLYGQVERREPACRTPPHR